jgi:hypothetical protein
MLVLGNNNNKKVVEISFFFSPLFLFFYIYLYYSSFSFTYKYRLVNSIDRQGGDLTHTKGGNSKVKKRKKLWLKGGNRSFTEGGKCVWVESTASHVLCINTLEGGGRKGFISSAVTCIIRQQHYPHGEAACRAVAYGPVSLSGWKMLK